MSMHCHPGGALRMPPRHGKPALPPPPPRTSSPARGGRCVKHLAPARGFPVAVAVPERDEDLAGVPPEMLPPKKRLVRFHPCEAASTILDMASRGGFGSGAGRALVAVEGDGGGGGGRRERDGGSGLRAELLRLRIARPTLVLTKRLTPSDRSRDRARLVLPDGAVRASPLFRMLTAAERHLVLGGGLPVAALDGEGRRYRMVLRRDRAPRRTFRLTGQWSLFLSRHGARGGDAVEVLAFRPPSWQARLDSHGEGGLGIALLHCRNGGGGGGGAWCSRERDAADGLLLLDAHINPNVAAITANTESTRRFLAPQVSVTA